MIAVFDKEESLRACLASILEIDFNLIPKQKNDKFENDINEFLIKEHGIFMAPCSFNFRKNNNIKYFNSTFLIGFKKNHSVIIYKNDIIHDPIINSNLKFDEIEECYLLLKYF